MKFGKRLAEVRKDKKLSQEDIAKKVGVHAAVIGRYEREEVKPSIEIATQIAEALAISLDYLVGSTEVALDKNTTKRIQDIQKLSQEDKKHFYALLDAFLLKANIQQQMEK